MHTEQWGVQESVGYRFPKLSNKKKHFGLKNIFLFFFQVENSFFFLYFCWINVDRKWGTKRHSFELPTPKRLKITTLYKQLFVSLLNNAIKAGYLHVKLLLFLNIRFTAQQRTQCYWRKKGDNLRVNHHIINLSWYSLIDMAPTCITRYTCVLLKGY